MANHIPPLNYLRAFEAAGRLGGFNLAADELNLSQSTVSYRIGKLESDLGVLLFQRLTRRTELTKDGLEFLPTVTSTLRQLQDGVDKLGTGSRRALAVTLSSYLAMRWLSPNLAHWSSRYPNVDIHLDHDMKQGAVESDIVIFWCKHATEQQSTQLLFETDMSPYCTPQIAATLKTPKDILKHPLLTAQPHLDTWPEWMELAGISDMSGATCRRITDSNVRIKAAVDGLGIVLGNRFMQPEVDAGFLVRPFDIAVHGPGFYSRNQSRSPDVADRFVRWLQKIALSDN